MISMEDKSNSNGKGVIRDCGIFWTYPLDLNGKSLVSDLVTKWNQAIIPA